MKPLKKYSSHLEAVQKQKVKHLIEPKVARKFFNQYKKYIQETLGEKDDD